MHRLEEAWIWVKRVYARWNLAMARDFAAGLEDTIARERQRARDWIHDAEMLERRAFAAKVAARADADLRRRTA